VAGGGSTAVVHNAAYVAFFGLDPIKYLNLSDPVERALYQEVATRLKELHEIRDHNLAVEIANQVGRLFKR
jgi:hypothetical protein